MSIDGTEDKLKNLSQDYAEKYLEDLAAVAAQNI